MLLNGGKLAWGMQMGRIFKFMRKILTTERCLSLPRGYIHVYDNNIQTNTSLKLLGQLKPNLWSMVRKGQ